MIRKNTIDFKKLLITNHKYINEVYSSLHGGVVAREELINGKMGLNPFDVGVSGEVSKKSQYTSFRLYSKLSKLLDQIENITDINFLNLKTQLYWTTAKLYSTNFNKIILVHTWGILEVLYRHVDNLCSPLYEAFSEGENFNTFSKSLIYIVKKPEEAKECYYNYYTSEKSILVGKCVPFISFMKEDSDGG